MADDRDYASEMTLLNTYDPIVELTPEQESQVKADYQRLAEENIRNAPNIDWSVAQRYYTEGRSDSLGNALGILLAVASFAVPGIGQIIGSSILSAVGITGASAAVTAGVGAAALSAASTAAQGGSVEDVLKSAASAGVASGLNVGMGGGVAGAVTGSTAGTILKGGDASQVLTNAFAAGVGAGVQGALPDNPDAGKIIGTAARTYIVTGGNVDQTLLNTAAAAIGTLDQPAKTAQQAQAAVTPANDAAAQEAAAREIEAVTQSDAARQQELADYQETLNQYAIDKAIYEQTYGPIETPPAAAVPTPAAEATLPPQTVVAPAPVVSPVVTDLDLVRQVAAQPTPTIDPQVLERVIVQGQGANVANVAPVETTVTTPVQQEVPGGTVLPPVEVVGTTEKLPESGFEEYSPVEGGYGYEYRPEPTTSNVSPVVTDVSTVDTVDTTPDSTTLDRVIVTGSTTPDTSNVSPVVTDLPPDTTTDTTVPAVDTVVEEPKKEEPKKEEPKKEEEPPKKPEKIYPTVTGVPPVAPSRRSRQPIITGASPARLLADALAAYRPSGSVEGGESGKERQNVWNEKSLRLKDALGL
jgi:hypothetical protein